MLTSASTQLLRKHCSSHVGSGQSSDLQTDQPALLPPLLLVRPQQHLVEEQQLTMMMTCTTSHVDCITMSVLFLFFLLFFLLYKCRPSTFPNQVLPVQKVFVCNCPTFSFDCF